MNVVKATSGGYWMIETKEGYWYLQRTCVFNGSDSPLTCQEKVIIDLCEMITAPKETPQ